MNPARYLLAPWWLAQLATGSKAFCDNPLIGSRRLNELGLHETRVRLAHQFAASRRRRLSALVDPADRAAFDRDGFVEKRDFLPAAIFERLRDALFSHAAPAREMIQGDTITRRIALDPELLAAVPQARGLLADPVWRGLIRYAGSFENEPLSYVQTILSGRIDAPADPQTALHADTFHPTVKAWLFLTHVAEDEGPFCYVPGSHRLTPARIAWERTKSLDAKKLDRLSSRGSLRIESNELAGLGLPPPRLFAVPANTLIVADTFGFHARGPSARPSVRVEIWAYGRRNPFLPWIGLDLLSMPGVAERRIPWLWAARDRLEPWMGQPWRNVGRKRPDDA
jgi:hypothetical protein